MATLPKVHPIARTLAMEEALVGQLYPAILIARLVTLHAQTPRPRKEKEIPEMLSHLTNS